MKKFLDKTINYILFLFLKEQRVSKTNITDPEVRKKYAYLEAWLSIICNLLLSITMFLFGLSLNSIALMANAAHTASDVLSSVVVLLGFKFSSMPADTKHPFGHGRIEFLATLIISVLLIIVGIEFAINSYHRYIANALVLGNYMVVAIMVFFSLFKLWMAEFSSELGKRTDTPLLIADAWHHKTDGIAMMLVVISIIFSKFGYYRVDAILGVLVSILIIYTGTNLLKGSSSKLIGEVAEKSMIKEVENSIQSIPEVISVHKIMIHDYGSHKEITLHIQLSNDIDFMKAHSISERVEREIESRIHCKAIVHAEPLNDLMHS
jgi:cation diffusion facilitator family transporter